MAAAGVGGPVRHQVASQRVRGQDHGLMKAGVRAADEGFLQLRGPVAPTGPEPVILGQAPGAMGQGPFGLPVAGAGVHPARQQQHILPQQAVIELGSGRHKDPGSPGVCTSAWP